MTIMNDIKSACASLLNDLWEMQESAELLSFHGNPAIKDKYINRLKEHHRLDQIIKGRGCAEELGLPIWLAYLENAIFEELHTEKAPQFAVDFLEAIPVGVCVENVKWQLAIARHTAQLIRLENCTETYAEECRNAIKKVIELCSSKLNNELYAESAESVAEFARSSGRSAVSSGAVWCAVRSALWTAESARFAAKLTSEYDAWSAQSAANSDAWVARSVFKSAWSRSARSAESAARSEHYKLEAKTLIKLLKECR